MRTSAILGATMATASRMASEWLRLAIANGASRPHIHRVPSGTKQARQLSAKRVQPKRKGGFDPYGQGVKEQKRAKRCYMQPCFPNGTLRSAPVMLQMSKRQAAECEAL